MNITTNKVVSLSYELRIDGKDGEIVETVNALHPLTFLYGAGNLLPAFERHIDKLTIGDEFSFLLKSEDAYGQATEDALVEMPISVFMVDDEIDNELLVEGNAIPMTDSQGNHHNGIVAEIKKDTVVMDFNHPLAGDNLFFTGTVVDIRDATAEELAHGHVHTGCSSHNCDSCQEECS
jgi:FKBP-type peptidyl-prolyl cis-trans isomerase SlyD